MGRRVPASPMSDPSNEFIVPVSVAETTTPCSASSGSSVGSPSGGTTVEKRWNVAGAADPDPDPDVPPPGAAEAPGPVAGGQTTGWTNDPVAPWPLKSTVAMLPSRASERKAEYGIAADDELPKGMNRMTFQTMITARKTSHPTQPETRGRPGPDPSPPPVPSGRDGSGGRSRAGGVIGASAPLVAPGARRGPE